jgi:hypothetical protein
VLLAGNNTRSTRRCTRSTGRCSRKGSMGMYYVRNVPGLSLRTSYASQLTPLPALTCDWVPPLLVMPDTSEFIERRRGAALLVTFVFPQRVWFEKNVVGVICTFIRSPEGVILKQYCGCDLYFHTILRRCDLKKIFVGVICTFIRSSEGVIWKNIMGVICTFIRSSEGVIWKKIVGVISNDEFHTILRRCDLNKCCGCDFKWWWEVCVLDGACQVNIKSPWHNNDTPTPTMPPSPPWVLSQLHHGTNKTIAYATITHE